MHCLTIQSSTKVSSPVLNSIQLLEIRWEKEELFSKDFVNTCWLIIKWIIPSHWNNKQFIWRMKNMFCFQKTVFLFPLKPKCLTSHFIFFSWKGNLFRLKFCFCFLFLFIFCFCCLFYFLYWPLSFRSKNNLTKQNSFDSLIPSPFLSFISFDVIVFFVQSFHWQKSKIMGWVDGEEWYWNDMFLFRFFLIFNLIWKQTCIEWIVCYVTNVQQTSVSW
jgi:hypothetical protein